MKSLATIIFIIILHISPILSQIPTQDSAFTVMTISPAQSFYLDSRLMSNINGRSRLTIPVNLPEGTIRWYYSFAAIESKNEPLEWVGLAGQLTKLIDKTGIASEVINRLVKPAGTAVCDIFLLNTEGIFLFENKEDHQLIIDKDFSRQNMTGGVVEVWVKNRRPVIGLSNPSLKTGINVKIEISAVVAKMQPEMPAIHKEMTWNKTQKEDLWTKMAYAFDGKKNQKTDAVTLCAIDSFTHLYTFDEYALMTEMEKNFKAMSAVQTCFSASGNQELGIEMGEVASTKAIRDSLEQVNSFGEMVVFAKRVIDWGYPSVPNRMKLARAYVLTGKSTEALDILLPLLRLMPNDWMLNLNTAHAYLFRNDYNKAENMYFKFKKTANTEGITWEQFVNADFKFMNQNRIFHSRFENIKKKLKINE